MTVYLISGLMVVAGGALFGLIRLTD